MHDKGLTASAEECGVYSCCRSLSSSFFIACGAVNLSCKEKALYYLRFQRVLQLCWVEVIIFYGISRTVDFGIAECGYLMDGLQLRLPWHGGREAVEVHLVRVGTFGFEEERMAVLVRERNKLRFYRRTVPWSGALYLSVEERRVL